MDLSNSVIYEVSSQGASKLSQENFFQLQNLLNKIFLELLTLTCEKSDAPWDNISIIPHLKTVNNS